jgi:hypothetical protein
MVADALIEVLIVATLAALVIYFFEGNKIIKKWTFLCTSIIIGIVNYILGFLIELPLTFISYVLLSFLFRLSLFILILKASEEFFGSLDKQNFRTVVGTALFIVVFGGAISFSFRIYIHPAL